MSRRGGKKDFSAASHNLFRRAELSNCGAIKSKFWYPTHLTLTFTYINLKVARRKCEDYNCPKRGHLITLPSMPVDQYTYDICNSSLLFLTPLPCPCYKSADFVPFICFWGPPPPLRAAIACKCPKTTTYCHFSVRQEDCDNGE